MAVKTCALRVLTPLYGSLLPKEQGSATKMVQAPNSSICERLRTGVVLCCMYMYLYIHLFVHSGVFCRACKKENSDEPGIHQLPNPPLSYPLCIFDHSLLEIWTQLRLIKQKIRILNGFGEKCGTCGRHSAKDHVRRPLPGGFGFKTARPIAVEQKHLLFSAECNQTDPPASHKVDRFHSIFLHITFLHVLQHLPTPTATP